MVLELHIWGPAFSLPSIDPQCLVTVLYLRQTLPDGEWVLIASSDDAQSPTKTLPTLRDGPMWVGGFRNIIDHLSRRSDHQWDLDSINCHPSEKADIYAFSAFVELNGQCILDLSLFVSSENYTSTTRPAYSRLLQWPDQWFISPQKRSLAKARTDHLGLSSLDLDSASEEHKKHTSTPSDSSIIPQSLRLPRQTVTSLVKQPQHAARFRLDALADNLFRPLQQLLGNKHYMLSVENPSSLDCVAFAYLALALTPQMPHAWLAEAMKTRYPSLCKYVDKLSKEFFGGPVAVSDALLTPELHQAKTKTSPHAEASKALPWGKPKPKTLGALGSTLLGGTVMSLPLAGHFGKSNILLENHDPELRGLTTQREKSIQNFGVAPPLLAAVSTVAAVGAYAFYSSFSTEPESQHNALSDMGEAGAILDLAAFGGYSNASAETTQRPGRIPVGLEVDVEVDDKSVQ